MYLRFVHLRVREGQEGAFTRFYQERAIPALAVTEGCLFAGLLAPWRGESHQSLTIWRTAEHAAAYEERGVYRRLLAEAVDHPLEVLSITLWDREEDAVRYEMSGDFERLTSRLAGTYSPVYDWRTRLGDDTTRGRADVSSYQVVRGRRLAEPEDGTASDSGR